MKDTMVLYTAMGPSHLVPMVELAKLFLSNNLSVAIVTADLPYNPGSMAQTVSRISPANPSISFHILPALEWANYANIAIEARFFASLRDNNRNLLDFLTSFTKTNFVRAIVFDFFSSSSLDVAQQLLIPAYIFTAFGASDVAMFLHVTELHKNNTVNWKNMGKDLVNFPGIPPIIASDLPMIILDRESDSYKTIMETLPNLVRASGILINSFESLEPKAVATLTEGLCVPSCKMPPVYCIGPLISQPEQKEGEGRHESLAWLDLQPKKSVVFLCFGTYGAFRSDQIKQIAVGLENSRQRFLWVIKAVREQENMYFSKSITSADLIKLMPEGFLDRTQGKGMVIQSWVPQLQVLQHEAVGGFVTHCGWNSILEAVTAGVPMICWPLYAEQRLNKLVVVEEIKIGAVMEGYDEDIVNADQVEAKVRWLMESEGGRIIKERVAMLKDKVAEALREDGSSSKALMHFMTDLRGTNSEGKCKS